MPISENALIARINRRLAHEEQRLRKSRKWSLDTGNYYIVDIRFNTIVAAYDDLVEVARDVGVMRMVEDKRSHA